MKSPFICFCVLLLHLSCTPKTTSGEVVKINRYESFSIVQIGSFTDTVYMDYPYSELTFYVDSSNEVVYFNEYNRNLLAISYSGELLYSYPLYKYASNSNMSTDYFIGKFGDKIVFSTNATLLLFHTDLRLFRDVIQEDVYDSPEGPSLHHRLCRFNWNVKKDTLYFSLEAGLDCTPGAVDDTLYRKIPINFL